MPGALIIDAGLFVVAFVLQFAVRRYIPGVYWLAVAAVGVVGTLAVDVTHFFVGVPLWATITGYGAVLAVNFALWYRLEGTLSIHSIHTRRREVFYWVAVFFTFAMGTAVGDLSAVAWHLGFLGSMFLFAVLIAIPAIAHRLGANAVLTFWCGYVLTRPLGASIADWLAVTLAEGGLNLGTGPVTLGAIALVAVLVGYLTLQHRRRPPAL